MLFASVNGSREMLASIVDGSDMWLTAVKYDGSHV